jgi:hypothetical protein
MSAIVRPGATSRSIASSTGRVRGVGDVLGLVEHLEDALAGCGRALRLPDPHPERAQGHDEEPEVEVERDEAAGRQRVVQDHPRADEQHGRLRDQRQEREERDVRRALPVRLERLVEHELRARAKLLDLGRLLCEGLHDVDADDVLLRDR